MANPTLRDFIATRRAEIKEAMASMRSELKELDAAEAALGTKESAPQARPTTSRGDMTIQDMAQAVLQSADAGLDANEILAAIKQAFGKDIPRNSLSPQLSRLKDAGKVIVEGKTWKLASHPTGGATSNLF